MYAADYPDAWSYALPNSWNFTFSYRYFLLAIMLLYIPRTSQCTFIEKFIFLLILKQNFLFSFPTNVSSHVRTATKDPRRIGSFQRREQESHVNALSNYFFIPYERQRLCVLLNFHFFKWRETRYSDLILHNKKLSAKGKGVCK